MPKETVACEHCGKVASYVRTHSKDIEDRSDRKGHESFPMVGSGDHHVYRCAACGHLTRVPVV